MPARNTPKDLEDILRNLTKRLETLEHNVPKGPGVTGAPVHVYDEGVDGGIVTILNYVGTGVTAVVGGSTATISVPGGSGAPSTATYVTVADETAILPNSVRALSLSVSIFAGSITDAQHGARTTASAHPHSSLSGIGPNDHRTRLHDHSDALDSSTLIPAVLSPSGTFQFTGTSIVSPAQITADQNNYAPAGIATAAILRLSSDATRTITGLGSATSGRLMLLMNVGAFNIILSDENASSTAANRFALTADITMVPDMLVILVHDNTTNRWRAVSGGTSGGSTAPTRPFAFFSG